jgi:1-acyl-sn-glycerol-3-phosphate acyltransferase
VRTPVLDLFRPGVHALCRAYFGLELVGVEHIPATGPVIITPNHQTYADPPLVSIPVRRPIYYMAWSRLFEIPLFGRLIRLLRAFPVQIESSDPKAAREAVRLLQAGRVLMIFPEGERSRDGRVQRFKPGAFRLAASLATPVLPVTIIGGHEAWPPGRLLPRPRRITITYHRPIHPDPSLEPRQAARDLAARAYATVARALAQAATR